MSYIPPQYADPRTLSRPAKYVPPPKQTDVKDYLFGQLKAQGTPAEEQYTNFISNPPPGPIMNNAPPVAPLPSNLVVKQRGVTDTYMLLDSLYKNAGRYSEAVVQFLPDNLNSNRPVKNIVQMKIGSFYFPRPTWNEPLKSTTPDYLYLRRIYLSIPELPTAAGYSSGANRSYHWEFEVQDVSSIAVYLVPIDPIIYFENPVSNLPQLSCKFLINPSLEPLILYRDKPTVIYVGGGNFVFTEDIFSSVSTEFPPLTPGLLTVPVAMWVESFTGVSNIPDLLRPQGWFITNMTAAAPYGGFTVAALAGLVGPIEVVIQLRKNRFAIPLRISEAQDISTTGLVPGHS